MKRFACLISLVLLLLTAGVSSLWAEADLPPKLQKLTDDAYGYFSSRQTDKFFETIDKVKEATEFSGFQQTYYRARSYEAIYMFEYVDRKKGVELSHDIYRHAKANNSNIGMYYATFTLGSIRERSGNNDMAEKSFLQALELSEKYLPDESAAPCYLGLCEIALRKKDYEKVQQNARKALDEPKVIPMNQITAWSYKCLVRYNQHDSLGFEEAYAERARLMEKYGGQGGIFGELLSVYQAKNRKQWELALQRTDKLIHMHNRCAQRASIYEHMGDFKQALYWEKKTREVMDSVQSSEARSQMIDFDTELSLTYAENDAKEKALANEKLLLTAVGIIAAVIIVFLLFFAWRRNTHMKRLEVVHNELQDAYDKLEVTTKAKERIESELRIARDIQMHMLPHVFPRRNDVDIYAMMTPARRWEVISTAIRWSMTCSISAWATSAVRECPLPSSWPR